MLGIAEKTTKYLQKVKLLQQRKEDMYVDVDFATCEGCPAGQDGGLCQHIFALLMAIEKSGPRPGCSILPGERSVTSLRQSWGIRERNVKPHLVSQVVIEKSKPDEERKKRASGSLLFEAHGKNTTSTPCGHTLTFAPQSAVVGSSISCFIFSRQKSVYKWRYA